TREELTFIADLCKKYDTYCITDEVYEHIVYAPHEHVYMATLPGMFERTISCSSLSKTYSITGWRLGYTIAPAEITERIKKVHDFLTVGAAAPLQEAVVTALNFDDSYYQEVLDLYTAKRDLFCQGLGSIGLTHNVPQGAYYVMMDISEFGYDSDLEFCEDLALRWRGRCARLELLPRARQPSDSFPLCQARRDANARWRTSSRYVIKSSRAGKDGPATSNQRSPAPPAALQGIFL
ncbi:MAG: pyridoxal phosphate-dependent aminotransferase, partial [Collinsella sp.]